MRKPVETECPPAEGESALRQRILDAAFGAFLECGYHGTSTLEIASRAKVSKRELYAHFGSKEALFAAGIKNRSARMRVPLDAPDVSDRAGFARTLQAYGETLLTEVTHPNVIAVHRLVIAESTRSPELAAILDREGRQANMRAVVHVMRDAQKHGLVGAGKAEGFANVFSALLWGDTYLRLLMRVIEPPTAAEIRSHAAWATKTFLSLHGA